MSAGTWNITIDQGETWDRTLTLRQRYGPHIVSTDGATAGTFYVVILGARSPAIAYDATPAAFLNAIERTSTVGAVGVESVGGAAGAWELTFSQAFRTRYLQQTHRQFSIDEVAQFVWDDLTTPGRAGVVNKLFDLTGYSATHSFKYRYDDASAAFSSTVTLGGTDGTARLVVAAATLAALTRYNGVHDLRMVSGASVISYPVRGQWAVNRRVSA